VNIVIVNQRPGLTSMDSHVILFSSMKMIVTD